MAGSLDGPRLAAVYEWRDLTRQSDLEQTSKHVALILALHMDRSGETFVGPARIARETGLHERTVRRCLAALCASGWLRIAIQGGAPKGLRRTANVYACVIPNLGRCDPGQTRPRAQRPPYLGRTIRDLGHTAHLTSKELVDDLATPDLFLDEWGGDFTIPVGEGEPSVATTTDLA